MRNARAAHLRSSRWTAVGHKSQTQAVPLFSLGVMNALALALLVVVALAATYGIFLIERGDNYSHQIIAWSTCGMLVCLAILMLLIGRYLMQRSLRHLEDQLRTLTREDRLDPLVGSIPPELQATLSALEDYVERVRVRVDRLRIQRKELDLQMRTAQAERRHTEAIIFSISDAVLVVDTFGELALANHAAQELFRFRLAEARHRPIERIIQDTAVTTMIKEARTLAETAEAGKSDEKLEESDIASLSGGFRKSQSGSMDEKRIADHATAHSRQIEYSQHRDGKLRTFTITLSTVVGEDGQARGVVAIFHDITHERELAQLKTDFVSAVSHELRTPLSSIKAYVEMLVDGEVADEKTRGEFYKIIEGETDRLQRLIIKVLDISRIESGVMDVRRGHMKPDDIIHEVLDMVQPHAREKQIRIETEFAEKLLAIHADRDLFYQAVQNVVSNAIKYTPAGGSIHLSTQVDEANSQFLVSVSDTGMGIRPEDLPRIFEKFYRSREGVAAAKGTGLGLNLVKQIVETVHGGAIDVTSEHGVGSRFILRFPLRAGC